MSDPATNPFPAVTGATGIAYSPNVPANWSGALPTNAHEAFDKIAAGSSSAGGSLQTAYNAGATIALAGGVAVAISSTTADNGSVLTITKNPVGAQSGSGASVTMGATTTGAGIAVSMTAGATGAALSLSGGTKLFIESTDGSTSAVSGAATGRIRYNNGTAAWEQSIQGGAWAAFGGGSLQSAYNAGNTIALTGAKGEFYVSDVSATNQNVISILKDPAGAQSGNGFNAAMGAHTTGHGLFVNMTSGSSGNGVYVASAAGSTGGGILVTGGTSNGWISCAQNGEGNSERFGSLASARVDGVALGQNATAGIAGVAVGRNSTMGGVSGVVIGHTAGDGGFNDVVVLGRLAVATAANQFVVGGNGHSITSAFFGNGPANAVPANVTLNATGGSGAGVAGASMTFAAGVSGDAATAGGSLVFQTSRAGTGTASTTALTIDATGLVIIAPSTVLQFGVNVTGAGTAALGAANSPATVLGAPYQWVTVQATDGTVCYVPIWK